MKTIKFIIIAIVSVLTVTNTNVKANNVSNEAATINLVVVEYLKLKDALVKSNTSDAIKAATSMQSALKNVSAPENDVKKLVFGISTVLNDLLKTVKLEQQRVHFKTLSDNFHKLIVKLKPEQTLHRQYCPMAFGNKGGYWLSAEKEVRNPYFGDAMLKCGKVVETIN